MKQITDRLKKLFIRIGELYEITPDPVQLEYLKGEMLALKRSRNIIDEHKDDLERCRYKIMADLIYCDIKTAAGRGSINGYAMALVSFHDNDIAV